MSWTVLTPLIIVVGSAIAIIAAERRWPYDHQSFLRPGLGIDLIGYALAQSWILALVIGGFVDWIDSISGASAYGVVLTWPFAAQVAFFVVTHDLYIYWFHRWQHANRWLWRLHEAHHSARYVDWIAGARSHAGEVFVNQTIEVGVMTLLGAQPDVILCKGAISVVWGMWIHAKLAPRPRLRRARLQLRHQAGVLGLRVPHGSSSRSQARPIRPRGAVSRTLPRATAVRVPSSSRPDQLIGPKLGASGR